MSPSPTPLRRLRGALVASLALLAVGGCGGDEQGPYPVESGREREAPDRTVPPGATTARRLLPQYVWSVPPLWEEGPPDKLRLARFRVPGTRGSSDGEVSLSRAGGGVLANVNRWRAKQMGLPEIGQAEVDALPRGTLLGRPAVSVDLEGDYTPMGARGTLRGWRMLGLILEQGDASLFLKFVGPAPLVQGQRSTFGAFAASVRDVWNESSAPARPVAPDPARLGWDLPKGWTAVQPTQRMRVSDFRIADAPGVEVVLSKLGGEGGGIPLNVNRWRRQMGAEDLTDDEIGRLERFDMLGAQAVWVEIPGHYRGMSGEDVPEALFVGVICPLPGETVFLRLVGPRAATEPQRDAFRALCRSLRVEGGR